jgi:Outer membrane lipoprotein carrier protein LolA-like
MRAARIFAALLLIALGDLSAAGAATPAGFDELMALLATRRQGHVPFTEVQTLSMLQEPLRSSGELFYAAPDHLEKRTLTPKPESLVLEHGVITVQRGRRTRVLELADYPQVVPFVESIRATLAGDRSALERYFDIDFTGDVAHWTLDLKPKDPTVAKSVAAITFSGEHALISTIAIRQSDGDHSLMAIGPEITP